MTTQLSLMEFVQRGQAAQKAADDITANYHKGNVNSVAAHKKVRLGKQKQLNRVLAAIAARGEATCEQIESDLSMSHQSCSARLSDSKRLGFIRQVGTAKTKSGCSAALYKIAP